MKYIKDADYNYIMNKYHDASKPFDPFKRLYTNHEAFFDESTGLATSEIEKGIQENDKKYKSEPHSVRKARAVEYVLQNTRISCSEKDRFPGICSISRPLHMTLIGEWRDKVYFETIRDVTEKRVELSKQGVVTLIPDYDHSAPRWDRLFKLGFRGIMKEAEKAKEKYCKSKKLGFEEKGFYDSIQIAYGAIIDFVYRLAKEAEHKNPRLHGALVSIAENPPQTFYEQLVFDYLFFIIMEHIEDMQCRTLGNFDVAFFDNYKKDIKRGVSSEEIRTDLAYFMLQFTAIGNYWGQPVYLGGIKEDGTTQINELSYEFLKVYDEIGIYNPKIQIKVSKNTPKKFLLKALDMIRRGHNSIVFVMDETVQKSLIRIGATPDEARRANITGCYEYYMPEAVPIAMIYFNLIKPLEYTLTGGYDAVSGELRGLETSTNFKSFEDLYNIYLKQLKFSLKSTFEIVNEFAPYICQVNPQPILSGTFETALERGKDVLGGGAKNPSCVAQCGYLANIADSLTVIKELCFDKKEYTICELKEILNKNWENNENLRLRILNRMDHYGNNAEIPDKFAVDISSFLNKTAESFKSIYGLPCGIGFHVARSSYTHGKVTTATPDGRRKGEELSKNVSPSMGRNTKGPTAAILSVTKINAADFQSDVPLDLGIHPATVKGEDGLEVMYSLLMTFEKRGGHAIHMNVFDGETLRKAQKEPEKYRDLQIRVCGWNVLFNNINKVEQDEFIRQADAL